MVKESNWEYDKAIEKIIIEYLVENFFSKDDYITYYDVNYVNLEEQKAGIDVVLSTADGILNKSKVDVKVAITYVNRNLPTFAFETSSLKFPYLNKDDVVPGWFIDESKETEYYLLGWIWADVPSTGYKKGYQTYDWKSITKDNITRIELYLIKGQNIKNYLFEKGWTTERIIRQDKKIRERGRTEPKVKWIDNFKFTITTDESRPETPINIVIRKPKLRENALYVKEIRKEREF